MKGEDIYMKKVSVIFALLATSLLCVTGCNKQSPNTSEEESSNPVVEREPPEFLTTLPIPSNLKQSCDKKGTVETIDYQTKIYDLNGNGSSSVSKKADVYLPYDYDETKCYNVLYLMHGGGETYSYWLRKEKDTVPVLDNIFANEIAEPCIVVAPSFYTGSSATGSMDSEVTDVFQYEFRNDLVPVIEEEYATYCKGDVSPNNLIKTREHRGFAGLSMGSMTSIRSALLGCLDICAYVSSMSGGYDADDNDGERGFAKVEEALTETFKDYPLKYWLNQNGTSDIALTPHQALNDLVLSRLDDYFTEDVNYKWILFPGGQHNFDAWLVHLYNTLLVFFY